MVKARYFNSIATLLVGCGIVAAFSSCRFEDEDFFDETAALRIETTTKAIQKTLVDAPNGWVMQYFTGTTEIEGFNLFAKFEDSQKVTLAGDHRYLRDGNAGKYTEYSSLYEILKEDGPVLAFNTWNDVLTPFIDPVDYTSAPGSLVKDGEGMAGDHNLVVLSYSKDEVLLRGERHSARVRLIPCPGSWQDYISATSKLKDYISNTTVTSYYVCSETDTLYFKNLRSGVLTYCERVIDPLFPSTLNCVFTPAGFRLHHQNDIKGVKFQEFKIDSDSTCLISENDSVRVIPCWDNYITNLSTVWTFDQDGLTAEQKAIYDALQEELAKANSSMTLKSLGLGSGGTVNGQALRGLIMSYSYRSKGRTVNATGTIALDMSKPQYGTFKIGYSSDALIDGNLANFANLGSNDVEGRLRAFAATLNGTFNIVPNHYFNPTAAQFKSTTGDINFILKK